MDSISKIGQTQRSSLAGSLTPSRAAQRRRGKGGFVSGAAGNLVVEQGRVFLCVVALKHGDLECLGKI